MSEGAGSPEARVCLGVVVGVHGVRGLVRVKPFTQDPMAVADYGLVESKDGTRRFKIAATGIAKGVVICRFDGISDRDVAEALRGTELYVARTALPDIDEDEEGYYHADLIGLAAEASDGTLFGRVSEVHNFGAGDLLEIVPPDGSASFLVSFTDENVPEVDIAGGRLTLVPPEGTFGAGDGKDEEEEADE